MNSIVLYFLDHFENEITDNNNNNSLFFTKLQVYV